MILYRHSETIIHGRDGIRQPYPRTMDTSGLWFNIIDLLGSCHVRILSYYSASNASISSSLSSVPESLAGVEQYHGSYSRASHDSANTALTHQPPDIVCYDQ